MDRRRRRRRWGPPRRGVDARRCVELADCRSSRSRSRACRGCSTVSTDGSRTTGGGSPVRHRGALRTPTSARRHRAILTGSIACRPLGRRECAVRHTLDVGASDTEAPRRRGRPPDTKSSETREAILSGARKLFGERGYGAVTNKDLAAAAGVTTGALYHYVESKLDLYLEVHRDMQVQDLRALPARRIVPGHLHRQAGGRARCGARHESRGSVVDEVRRGGARRHPAVPRDP